VARDGSLRIVATDRANRLWSGNRKKPWRDVGADRLAGDAP
jgi:hypothetical protein